MREEGTWIGYLAVQPRGHELFLSKIYVTSSVRRKGRGRKALAFAEALARERGLKKITLTVNKNNRVATTAYEKAGFRNTGSLVQDIGNGFVMDDYKMEKFIQSS
jgi:ribosomal protein S18 acetylase RimI-like enzyme